MKERHTPNPWSAYYSPPSTDAPRVLQSNGLYLWDPARDSSGYWALPWPWTQAQMDENNRALRASVRKDDPK